jgi:hypothetical protein
MLENSKVQKRGGWVTGLWSPYLLEEARLLEKRPYRLGQLSWRLMGHV